jgi:hypothetical protein
MERGKSEAEEVAFSPEWRKTLFATAAAMTLGQNPLQRVGVPRNHRPRENSAIKRTREHGLVLDSNTNNVLAAFPVR